MGAITYKYRIGNIITSVYIDLDAYPVSHTVSYDIADCGPADAHAKRHANGEPATDSDARHGDTAVDRHADGN